MKINDIYDVIIDSEDYIGNGVTRIDNIVVFIFGALKDEKVKIKITEINKHYVKGELLEIINKSNKRIVEECNIYYKCGGCNFLHTTYDNEINIKKDYLERLFSRNIDIFSGNNHYNYRNKVILHVLEGKLGYFNDKTHDLCNLNQCKLLNPKINLKIDELNKYDLNGLNEILIRCINNKIMINMKGDIKDSNLYNISCDSLYINDIYYSGEKYLIEEVDKYKFSIYPNSFFQVNNECMKLIYNRAKELIGKGNKLLDLYCGTGTIGIWMSNNYKEVTGIEINSSSIENANINKKLNNIYNINFICSDAKNVKGDFDSIIVDPPRAGLSKDVIRYLNNSKAKRVVYVSCNPITLKRDIDLLNNYNLIVLEGYSMFPRTKHCEMISLFERK